MNDSSIDSTASAVPADALGGQVLVLAVGAALLGLPAGEVRELAHLPELAMPPTLPPVLAGLCAWRGEVVPVVRLDRLLGLGERPPDLHATLAVVGRPPLALLAERAVGLVAPPQDGPRAADGDDTFNGCVDGTFDWQGRTVSVLALDRLLLAEERERLAAFRDEAARRGAAFGRVA